MTRLQLHARFKNSHNSQHFKMRFSMIPDLGLASYTIPYLGCTDKNFLFRAVVQQYSIYFVNFSHYGWKSTSQHRRHSEKLRWKSCYPK